MNPAPPFSLLVGALPLLLVPLAAVIGTFWPAGRLPALDRLLGHRIVPWLAGVITALVIRNVWGSLDAVPVIHDESAYLLQAALLAHGKLVGPARPLPEFFEQVHVFVTPVLAPRYPPGFSLALLPGIWLGLPGLMPVVLSGLTAALLIALVRRVSTPSVALLTWLLWVVTPGNLRFRPAYLTESLSGFLWLATWWGVLEWRASGRRGWLLLISGLIGWQAITRPLTAIAFALPIGILVLLTLRRTGRWRDLAPAMAVGLLCLSIIPYQNQVTTGNWRLTPLKHYSEVYFPFDLPGFGYDSTPPQRAWPPDFKAFADRFSPMHREFTPDRLPEILLRRSSHVLQDSWGRWLPSFALLAVIGFAAGGPAVMFGGLTCLSLQLTYLTFAHDENWNVYYLEGEAVLILAVALGFAWLARQAVRIGRGESDEIVTRRTGLVLTLLSLVVFGSWSRTIREARGTARYVSFDQERFRRQVDRLPGPSIVFVRYAADHDLNHSLITNVPDLAAAHAWLVYDRGSDNPRLMAVAPDRKAYLYEEERRKLTPLDSTGLPLRATADSTRIP
jgi:hypothetical protein